MLATPHFDQHTSYVALSRHRDNATVFYATDDFGGRARSDTPEAIQTRFAEMLSRARPKELAHDYLELESGSHEAGDSSPVMAEWETKRNQEVSKSRTHAAALANKLLEL